VAGREAGITDRWDGGVLRVEVVDTPAILTAALRSLVAGFPGVEIATDGQPPDLVLVACSVPADLVSLGELRRRHPTAALVLVASAWTGAEARAAIEAGARGCLSGTTTVEELAAALRQVARGEIALSREVTQAILADLGHARPSTRPAGPQLTPRETEVLALVCAGLGNKQIAQRLYLSLRTVENHLAAVCGKLGVANRTEAALLAVRDGLARAPDP